MNWLFMLANIVIGLVSWTILSIISSYNTARKIGFPIVISPVSPLNPLWILIFRFFPTVQSLKYLPFGLGTWAKCTAIGWTFRDKHSLHDELGPIFTIVTPAGNEVTVADPAAAHTILARRKEFIKPAFMYEQLNVFGKNLNTVEGEDWQRQRRLTAPNFNERTSSLVWNEALRQAQDMAQSWAGEGDKGTLDTVSDTATLALHVLTAVGFGISYPFHGGVRNLPTGHSMSYRDALSLCLRNIITFAIFPKKLITSSFLPKKLQSLGIATQEFQRYMEEMLTHERDMASKRNHGTANLIGSLLRASDEAQKSSDKNDPAHLGLTDDEIYGNIFAFNLAGHETTANTLATSIVLLAAHPDVQRWVAEEVCDVLAGTSDLSNLSYEETFPKLQRCLAVMYETLRLYGSIVFIPKSTAFHTQSLALNDKDHVLPPGTAINLNLQALHTDPTTWGPNALTWRPQRWLYKFPDSLREEHFISPTPGTYIPWADGPRACVGKKFSQVEFVGVLAVLFRDHRVMPVLESGEMEEHGRGVLKAMAEDSAIQAVTLQMVEPRRKGLRWEMWDWGGGKS